MIDIGKLNTILGGIDKMEITAATLTVTPSKADTPAGVVSAVQGFGPSTGWLCLNDKVVDVDDKFDPAALVGRIVLSGELANGDKSLHIRQSGYNTWRLFELVRSDGGDMLMYEELLAHTGHNDVKLIYEVYWRTDGECSELRPYASRFAGFRKEG